MTALTELTMVEALTGLAKGSFSARELPRRDDAVTDGNKRDQILANAPEPALGFFTVPKVVE